jgi:hypothetical protein
MTWFWRPLDAAGGSLPLSEGFGTQSKAEAWMASNWEVLAQGGAVTVVLERDGEVVYEMGLGAS